MLIITLTVFTVFMLLCCVVLPAIALSILGLSVMRERTSRPPQTSVPSLVGSNYESAETKVRESNLNRFQPAEDFFHSFALTLTNFITRVARGALVDRAAPSLIVLGHVRRHLAGAQISHKVLG